ncbi:MAG: site-2 protease family protein, partial [Planctomycetota bacterium]
VKVDYLLIAAEQSFWLKPESWWSIAQVVMGLGFVIFVHELGHFLVAKACGVKCEKFYVGFDAFDIKFGDTVLIPRSLLKWKWGETEYGIGIIPLGGYVKMLGQDDNPGNMEKEIQRSMSEGEEGSREDIESGMMDRSKMDPRSFLAKSVPQRMAIISAGVIFNIFFAILMAGLAFKLGVNYPPPIIGNVQPGSPAWVEDLNGIEIVSINGKHRDDYLPFIDVRQEVVINGAEKPLEIEYLPAGSEDGAVTRTIQVTPSYNVDADSGFALLGISETMSNRVAEENPLKEGFAAARAVPAIEGGDEIVKVGDMEIGGGFDLRRALTASAGLPVTFELKRRIDPESDSDEDSAFETIVTTVEANPRHELGLIFEWDAINAVQKGSPADEVGLQKGDVILRIDGQRRGDLMTFDYRMTEMLRGENPHAIDIEFERDGETQHVTVMPRSPRVVPMTRGDAPIAIDSLGLAIKLKNTVEGFLPDSPAEDSGIEIGDELTDVEFMLTDVQKEDPAYAMYVETPSINLEEIQVGWAKIDGDIQAMTEGTRFKFTFDRDGKEVVEEMTFVLSEDVFQINRGFVLQAESDFYQAEDYAGALSLGARQTWKETTRVWQTLTKIVTGKIAATNLGGPGMIAVVATSEASAGTSRLLLFLTLLSANLAIINFLPIPVLDGGHMMFLAYEGLFRRPVTEKVQIVLTYVGLFFILGLMSFVILMDITRLSGLF